MNDSRSNLLEKKMNIKNLSNSEYKSKWLCSWIKSLNISLECSMARTKITEIENEICPLKGKAHNWTEPFHEIIPVLSKLSVSFRNNLNCLHCSTISFHMRANIFGVVILKIGIQK